MRQSPLLRGRCRAAGIQFALSALDSGGEKEVKIKRAEGREQRREQQSEE